MDDRARIRAKAFRDIFGRTRGQHARTQLQGTSYAGLREPVLPEIAASPLPGAAPIAPIAQRPPGPPPAPTPAPVPVPGSLDAIRHPAVPRGPRMPHAPPPRAPVRGPSIDLARASASPSHTPTIPSSTSFQSFQSIQSVHSAPVSRNTSQSTLSRPPSVAPYAPRSPDASLQAALGPDAHPNFAPDAYTGAGTSTAGTALHHPYIAAANVPAPVAAAAPHPSSLYNAHPPSTYPEMHTPLGAYSSMASLPSNASTVTRTSIPSNASTLSRASSASSTAGASSSSTPTTVIPAWALDTPLPFSTAPPFASVPPQANTPNTSSTHTTPFISPQSTAAPRLPLPSQPLHPSNSPFPPSSQSQLASSSYTAAPYAPPGAGLHSSLSTSSSLAALSSDDELYDAVSDPIASPDNVPTDPLARLSVAAHNPSPHSPGSFAEPPPYAPPEGLGVFPHLLHCYSPTCAADAHYACYSVLCPSRGINDDSFGDTFYASSHPYADDTYLEHDTHLDNGTFSSSYDAYAAPRPSALAAGPRLRSSLDPIDTRTDLQPSAISARSSTASLVPASTSSATPSATPSITPLYASPANSPPASPSTHHATFLDRALRQSGSSAGSLRRLKHAASGKSISSLMSPSRTGSLRMTTADSHDTDHFPNDTFNASALSTSSNLSIASTVPTSLGTTNGKATTALHPPQPSLTPTDEPLLWAQRVSPDILAATPDQEKKRQEAINEVVYTEVQFVEHMAYLEQFYIRPLLSDQSPLPSHRRASFVRDVFWNISAFGHTNGPLADRLVQRQEEAPLVHGIGDVILPFLTDVFEHAYVSYASHQLVAKLELDNERATNVEFARFAAEVERLPQSKKLELNGYLTKPTTRLARYPLLLGAVLKKTPESHPDHAAIEHAISLIKTFLHNVNLATGRSEDRVHLSQLAQSLQYRDSDLGNYPLDLTSPDRQIITKGPLRVKARSAAPTTDMQQVAAYLLDNAFFLVREKKHTKEVLKKPIPLELLIISADANDDSLDLRNANSTATDSRPKPPRDANPSADSKAPSKHGFPLTLTRLGRHMFQVTVWTSKAATRQHWVDMIAFQQQRLRERNFLFDVHFISRHFFVNERRPTAAAPLDFGRRFFFGTDHGIYFQTLGEPPVCVIQANAVKQLDVLEEHGLLIALADNAVMAFLIDQLDPRDSATVAKRAKRIAAFASFFSLGQSDSRTVLCTARPGPVTSTIKVLSPAPHQPRIRPSPNAPFFRNFTPTRGPAASDLLHVQKEFYIHGDASSIHFLKTKICVGLQKSFSIVNLRSLETQPLLDPADSSLDFINRSPDAKPIAIFRIDADLLLCYSDFAFYISTKGWRIRPNWIIKWESTPTHFALHYPYILAFDHSLIEVRSVETSLLAQVIFGHNIKCLYTKSPSSALRKDYAGAPRDPYGRILPRDQSLNVILSDADSICGLRFVGHLN